jgi:hypothetical protein
MVTRVWDSLNHPYRLTRPCMLCISGCFSERNGYIHNVAQFYCSTVNFRLLVMDTSMHTQKPCSGGTKELNHIVYISTTNPLNTLCILACSLTSNLKYTVPLVHGFCVCMDVSMTSNLKLTIYTEAMYASGGTIIEPHCYYQFMPSVM